MNLQSNVISKLLGHCHSDSDGSGGCRDANNYDDILGLHVKKKPLWLWTASKLYRLSDLRLSAKLVPTFADREGCRVVSATDPLQPYCRLSRPLGLHVKVLKLMFLNRVRQTFSSSLQCIVMYNTKQ
jgi:hypothetical protein